MEPVEVEEAVFAQLLQPTSPCQVVCQLTKLSQVEPHLHIPEMLPQFIP